MRFYLSICVCLILLVPHNLVESCMAKKNMDGPKTSAELQDAIDKAASGSTIELLPIDYKGDFVLKTRNPEDQVTLKGNQESDKHTKIFGSGTALSVEKGTWTITSLGIESGSLGVSLKGPNNVLKSVQMKNVQNGVAIVGDGNTVDACSITASSSGIKIQGSDSKLKSVNLRGSGIRIEAGNKNQLKSVSISDIPKGSSGIEISGDSNDNHLETISLDGFVNVKGNSNTLQGISSKGPVNFLGCGNRLEKSSVRELYSSPSCTPPNDIGSSNAIKSLKQSPID